MNDNQIILRQLDEFALNAEALSMREAALDKAAMIGTVTDEASQKKSVEAQIALKNFINFFNKHYEAANAPILDAGRKLRAFRAKVFEECEANGLRLATANGEFQEQQRVKSDAAKRLADGKQLNLEAERDETLAAKDWTLEQQETIREEYAEKIRALNPPLQEVRAKGQVIADDWAIEIVNLYQLCVEHFGCVDCEPKLSEIKKLLNRGCKIEGITAKPIIKSGVRAAPIKKPIEV